jgi:hypothetical protein
MLILGSHGRPFFRHLAAASGRPVQVALALLLFALLPGLVHADSPPSAKDLERCVKAQMALTADDQLRGLRVDVTIREGLAILRGTVPTAELAELLVQKVQQMDGVNVVVRDRLEVKATPRPVFTFPEEPLRTTETFAGAPTRRAEAGLPGVDPLRSLIPPVPPPALVRAPDPAPRICTTPQAVAQVTLTGPQVSTSLRTSLPPPINTTSELAPRPNWSLDRPPQSETLPQVIARVRNADPRFAEVELRLDGDRLIVIGDGTNARRAIAMAFARELSRANPPGIEHVRVSNPR